MTIKTAVTRVSVYRKGDSPIYGESSTQLYVDDEGAGPFIVVSQSPNDKLPQEIRLEMEELDAIVEAAKSLLKEWPEEA